MEPISIFLLGVAAGAIGMYFALRHGLIRRTTTETTTECTAIADRPGEHCPECGAALEPYVQHTCTVRE